MDFLRATLEMWVYHASWQLMEDETIGLTHPFYHDLRSRGAGILHSEFLEVKIRALVMTRGWEFYKDTRVLYGSVIIGEKAHKHPKPTRMVWRPDKMICEYEIEGILIREENLLVLRHRRIDHTLLNQ